MTGQRMGRLCCAMAVWMAMSAAAWGREVSADGKVTDVTLYRGQAEVGREVPVSGASGSVELIVSNLPRFVQPGSIFGEGSEGVQVRAVRYRSRAVGEAPTKEIAELDDKILGVGDELDLIEKQEQLLAKRSAYLDKLEGFVAPTASTELSKGVLDAEALAQITKMSFEQRELVARQTVELRKDKRDATGRMNLLQRRRAQLASGHSKTIHEAVVFLEKAGNGAAKVRLTYLVSNCGWSPAYNFRADSAKKQVRVEYNGLITQMSGEDWEDVNLTLSTATPQLSAAAPGMAPFRVALARGEDPNKQISAAQLRGKVQSINQGQISNVNQQRNYINIDDNLRANWNINVGANDYQILEPSNGDKKLRVLQDERQATGSLSLSYQLKEPVSLASRNDQQMIRITQQALAGSFYHTAMPVLSPLVFREVELSNTTGLDLLRGKVSMYLDGRFVGQMEVPTVAQGQTFVVGLGADPQLKTTRELVKRVETTQGGNQVIAFDYRLVVENFSKNKLPVRVFDRVPYTEDAKDMRVTLSDMKDPISQNELYLRIDRPKGILRWDIEVPATASGAKARMVEYDYKLEYARDYYLANPMTQGGQKDNQPQLEQEFYELQMQRLSH